MHDVRFKFLHYVSGDSSSTEDDVESIDMNSFEGSREDLQPYRDELQVEYQIEPVSLIYG